jgi:hypothetical protein
MISATTETWVERIKSGTLNVSDLDELAHLNAEEVIDDLSRLYPIRFLAGSQRRKREVGLARSRQRQKYLHCLLLTSEGGRLTSLAAVTCLRIRRLRGAAESWQVTCGAGFNLYHDPDGWRLKLLEERTISLSEESLRKRGWSLRLR